MVGGHVPGSAWCVVSALDLLLAQRTSPTGGEWPAVLRPARIVGGGAGRGGDDAGGGGDGAVSDSGRTPADTHLCLHAMDAARASPVRGVHWLLRPQSTVIAESAHGPETSVILVGRVPHARGAGEPPVDPPLSDVLPDGSLPGGSPPGDALPGTLLLGAFATAEAPARIADLRGRPVEGEELAVVSRWMLPVGCRAPDVGILVRPAPVEWRRSLVGQLGDALARAQAGVQTETSSESETSSGTVTSSEGGAFAQADTHAPSGPPLRPGPADEDPA